MLYAQRGQFGCFEYFSVIVPASQLASIFSTYLEALKKANEISTMDRSQRIIDMSRIKDLKEYLNRDKRFFGSVIASFDGKIEHIDKYNLSKIVFSRDPYTVDGQHRLLTMVDKYKDDNTYNDSLNILLIRTSSLEDQQQIFTDINNNVKKTTASLNILYDHENPTGQLVRELSPTHLLEQEKNTVSGKSEKLVTPGVMNEVFCELLDVSKKQLGKTKYSVAKEMLTPWKMYIDGLFQGYTEIFNRESAKDVYRKQSIYPHSVTLMACIKVIKWSESCGINAYEINSMLSNLESNGFMSRANPIWDGRCILGSKMKKNDESILLTAVAIAAELNITPKDGAAKLLVASIEAENVETGSFF